MKTNSKESIILFEKLREILCEQFGVDEDYITQDTEFETDLDADSIDMIDLAMSLEDEFQVEVPDEELENFKTVSDVMKFIDDN